MGECQSFEECRKDSSIEQTVNRTNLSHTIAWTGSKFVIPDSIPFQNQSTFGKVEQAALQFCQQNNISPYYKPMLSRIIAYRQENIFLNIWNELSASGKEEFLEDLNSIQHDLMDSFYHQFIKKKLDQPRTIRRSTLAPPKITKQNTIPPKDQAELTQIGMDLLRQNKVVFMCAGCSIRFDANDKFLSPISLFSQKTCILDLFFLRLRKNTPHNLSLPIIINCNEYNVDTIQSYLRRKSYFGFNISKIKYCLTYSLAVFDRHGKYCINNEMKLIKRPAGTAASVQHMLNQGMSTFLKEERIEFIYFCGLENLLENPCDPLFLGMMKSEQRKIGGKCANPLFIGQNLSRYFKNNQTSKIELLTQQDINCLEEKSMLNHLPVALNSIVFKFQSLIAIIEDYKSTLFLAEKYHVLVKDQKIFNPRIRKIQTKKCYSFEKDLRDIISCIDDPLLLRVQRSEQYAPIVSKSNQYALDAAVSYYQKRLEIQLQQRA